MTRIMAALVLIILVLSSLLGCVTGVPQAKFTGIPPSGYPPLEVQFTDKSTGNISAWEWDLNGDGIPDSTIQNPKYTYESTGNYTVSLTVRGPDGNDTEVKKDYIEIARCPYFADFTIESIPENCQVQGNGTSCTGPTTVHFVDKSTGNVTAWAWWFGDNETSTEQNPNHTYTHTGNYNVILTVTTPECKYKITKWHYINVTIKVTGCG